LPNAANPARNLVGAGLGRISEKWPDSRFARARAEIQYHPEILQGNAATHLRRGGKFYIV